MGWLCDVALGWLLAAVAAVTGWGMVVGALKQRGR